jgi:hypothetical protein
MRSHLNSAAERDQQLEVITHGTPVEVTKPLALGNVSAVVRPVTASKSRACREGHTSGPCRWLFSAARPIGDVKSSKALHRYNVLKTPAVGVITV